VAHRSITVTYWMAFGTSCGQAASGNRFKKSGSMFTAAFCMNVFKAGGRMVCLKSCSTRWSNTMPESAKLAENGNLWTA
ncbi:MAG: hypothetical protein ABIM30_09800, partial [candidate division WOR-3 bacterium]